MGREDLCRFGLRLAPNILNAVADALNWCLEQAGIHFVSHYLDDFIIVTLTHSEECQLALNTLDAVCGKLGVPMAPLAFLDPHS